MDPPLVGHVILSCCIKMANTLNIIQIGLTEEIRISVHDAYTVVLINSRK